MWESVVELVRATIFATSQLCAGSLGGAVVLVSFGLRLATLPLALRVARQARAQQARLAELKPAVAAIERRHRNDPVRRLRALQELHRANGIRLASVDGIASMLLQMPILAALFAATRQGLGREVRFLWVADLARPDRWLALSIASLAGAVAASGAAAASAPGGMNTRALGLLAAAMTLTFIWSASSALALSVGGGALVQGLQSWLLARDGRRTR